MLHGFYTLRDMIGIRLFRLALGLIITAAGPAMAAGSESLAAIGGIQDSVICRADASQSYALYVPVACNGKACPIIYFFDPHGDGGHPLRKYKVLADRYGFILAGSNNSKNGNDWGMADRIWQAMSADTRSRLSIVGAREYLCGFSGGAKVAGYVAIQHPGVRGICAGGAGLPEGVSPGEFDFSLTMLAGEGDMNMTDLVSLNAAMDRTRTHHRLLLFDGIHEWAPESVMDLVFGGWVLDAMKAGLQPKDGDFITRYAGKCKTRVDAMQAKGDLVRAEQESKFAYAMLEGLGADGNWFRDKMNSIDAGQEYRRQLGARQQLLQTEQSMKNEYMQDFQRGDRKFWEQVVADLRVKAKGTSAEAGMHQRLLAFLSLAFYSLSNRMIQGGQNQQARQFVGFYEIADPTNSEAWYFSAVLDAREGKRSAVDKDLLQAIQCGFRDMRRLRQQPEFQQLSPALDMNVLQGAMRKKNN